MGFREGLLLGAVLLLSCGERCAATRSWFNTSDNETLNQIPDERATTTTTTTSSPQTNQTELRHLVRSPATYQLRSYQLRSPALSRTTQQSGELAPEQLETSESGLAQGVNSPVKQDSKVVVKFKRRVPVPADSVAVHCGEGELTIQVKQNFLGNHQLIRPSDLTLGGCPALSVADHVLHFQAELQDCGSVMTMTEDALTYTFSLMYSPTPIGNTFILKTNPAEVIIECHYQRRQYVSSAAARPTWEPFASNMLAEEQLHFSLRLMTEDWQSQRASRVYFPGDMMRVEVSVLRGHHIPLKVYADTCVATVTPEPNSQPRYAFIQNHGCFTDAKLTGAKSYFMPRSQEDKLHFQLQDFRLHQDSRNSLFVTCSLKATTLSVPIDSQNKACSFLTEANRWVASDGENKVCSCCETSCGEQRRRRSPGPDADFKWEGMAAPGPILLEEDILQMTKLPEHLPELVSLLQTHVVTETPSHPSIALLCGVGAALAVVMMVLACAVIHTRLYNPTGPAVCT